MDDREARERVARVEELLGQVESLPDPVARVTAIELVEALLDLYGEGLARVVAQVADARALAGDELVAHLLLIHGLHPVPLDERVRGALAEVRPYLESHGGDVELLGVEESVAHLRLEGSCNGCPSSRATLSLAIEEAIHEAAPDVERIEADGAAPAAPGNGDGLLQIENLAPPKRAWAVADAMPALGAGDMAVGEVAGAPLLFLRLGERVYAYRPDCADCGTSLGHGTLSGTELRCGTCGSRYDVRRAGRGVETPELRLEPVPLLTEHDGRVKVAVG